MKKIISLMLIFTCFFQIASLKADDNILTKKLEEFQKISSVFYKKIENLDENKLNTISSKIDLVFNKSYNECKKSYPIITNSSFKIEEKPTYFLLYDFINWKDVNSLSKDFFKNKNCYNTFLLLSLKQAIVDKNSEKQIVNDFENKAETFTYSDNSPSDNFFSESYFSREIKNINIWKIIDNTDWKNCSIYWKDIWKLKVINYWQVWEIANKYVKWDNSYNNVNYWWTKQLYDSNTELKDKNSNVLLTEEDFYLFDNIKLYFTVTDKEKLNKLYDKMFELIDSDNFNDEYDNVVKQIKQYFLIAINLSKNDILNKFNMTILSKPRQIDWWFIQLISKKDYEYNLDNNNIFVLKCSN